jgi:hypothetical protein
MDKVLCTCGKEMKEDIGLIYCALLSNPPMVEKFYFCDDCKKKKRVQFRQEYKSDPRRSNYEEIR